MQRGFQFLGVIVLALLLGWQLGVRSEQKRLIANGWQVSQIQTAGTSSTLSTASGSISLNPEKDADIDMIWRVWNLLLENYVDPTKLQSDALVQGAAAGLVRAVGDPYTVFMPPKENEEFHTQLAGTLEGIGAELADRDGAIVVVAPLKGSPAQKAGLLPDDYITAVDGVSTEGMTLNDVVKLIRGPKNTTVKLEVARAKEKDYITFTIVREQIVVPSVESKLIPGAGGQIGYVSLNQFGDRSIDELRAELLKFKDQQIKALILDLRYNGGGYLDGATQLVSMMLTEGEVVSVHHREGEPQRHVVTGKTLFPDLPLVVLVNEGTASASEITAGALQDHKRATIVGKKTFGKGTVQEVIELPGGSSLRVTIARWHTPSGKDLSKEGVHPDIEVERTKEDLEAKKDPQLDAAVEFLTTGKKPVAKSSSSSSSSSVSSK